MRLLELSLSNYRSFGDSPVLVEFADLECPISIIGANNSGKSNLIRGLLHTVGVRSSHPGAFSEDDFHLRDRNREIHIRAGISPPLLSANAFNTVTEMPFLDLRVVDTAGGLDVGHYCCGADGKKVYNARTMKRSAKKTYTANEKEALNTYQRSGAEQVHKWRGRIPVYYLGPETMDAELRPGRFSVLGKLIDTFVEEFRDPSNAVLSSDGVVQSHVGRSRVSVYDQAIRYLEEHVLSTPGFQRFVKSVEHVVREQLEIEDQGFEIRFSPPYPEHFFKNLVFSVREQLGHPLLPVTRMGTGFVSLFVVALLRALADAAEGGKIFLFEEPETFLHEHYQEYFYTVLALLAKKNQVICTTHSKKFVDVFEPRSIIRLAKSPDGSTRVIAPRDPVAMPESIGSFHIKAPEHYAKYLRTLEPNIGNIAFASRVVVVEGPHDVLAYKMLLGTSVELALHNTAIVAAWGKDSLLSVIDLCHALEIPCFVVHDSDLPAEVSVGAGDGKLKGREKAEFTKNRKIRDRMDGRNVHVNVPNLEGVLSIRPAEKSPEAVFGRLQGLTLDEARKQYPGLLPTELLEFVGIEVERES